MHLKYPVLKLGCDGGVCFGDLVKDRKCLLGYALLDRRERQLHGLLICLGMEYVRMRRGEDARIAPTSQELPGGHIARTTTRPAQPNGNVYSYCIGIRIISK